MMTLSIFWQTKIAHIKDKKFSKLQIVLMSDANWKGWGVVVGEGGLIRVKREICCNLDDFSKKKIHVFHRRTGKLIK